MNLILCVSGTNVLRELPMPIPLTRLPWAAGWEAYAELIAEHLTPATDWLDAGCGRRLLEDGLETVEDWLADHCRRVIGMDVFVSEHRNIRHLVSGSLYALPFAAASCDLITCHMVVEHLDDPALAFAEMARCLKPGGAVVIRTPNLMNYGVFGNSVASRIMPERWRLRLVHNSDSRPPADIFPVRYKANTKRGLARLLNASGLQVHKTIELPQQTPFFQKTAKIERLFMRVTPISALLVCAHRR
jgi:SAM-dependent methyltransferase